MNSGRASGRTLITATIGAHVRKGRKFAQQFIDHRIIRFGQSRSFAPLIASRAATRVAESGANLRLENAEVCHDMRREVIEK